MKKTFLIIVILLSFLYSKGQTTAPEYYKQGIKKDSLKQHTDAINAFTKAIELNPKMALYYHKRGEAKGRTTDLRGAIDDYTKAIELDSTYSESYTKRGNVKAELMDGPGSVYDYTKAIKLAPNNALLYYNRGCAKAYLMEDYKGACLDMVKADKFGSVEASNFMKSLCK